MCHCFMPARGVFLSGSRGTGSVEDYRSPWRPGGRWLLEESSPLSVSSFCLLTPARVGAGVFLQFPARADRKWRLKARFAPRTPDGRINAAGLV
ncbi:hypothetical protein NDU88_004085 [Pleurodeles waltl]|uniref:Uncharacterized protein n=1 Tax=Pleurodeles waltl TaxID=8319 RepID=A0AAV7VJP1_PLEWA|nr:hypothetical protein NDU88_004085 [Pleurodeles waltl]